MASLTQQRILLIGNQQDPLHSGYMFTIKDGNVEFPSVDHFAYVQMLLQLGLYHQIEHVIKASSLTVANVALDIIKRHMPPGVTFAKLQDYLRACRESYIYKGLRLRLTCDPMFEKCLLLTGDAVLIVCDPHDTDFGIGMDENTFKLWRQQKGIQTSALLQWIQNPGSCPDLMIGRNKLGLFLMTLRESIRTQRARSLREPRTCDAFGLTFNEQFLSLTGIFRPLSNTYATPIFVRKVSYRSVEHYVYEKLLRKLKLDEFDIHKIRCTVDPSIVWQVAAKVATVAMDKKKLKEKTFNRAWKKMTKWYAAAMEAKVKQFSTVRRLLLATGQAVLIETHPSFDEDWSIGTDETEMQHLLTKKYMAPKVFLNWMLGDDEYPVALAHFGKNKTGTMLMQLRQRLLEEADQDQDLSDSNLRLMFAPNVAWFTAQQSSHMLCFTPSSVFHSIYPATFKVGEIEYNSVEHYVRYEAVRFFGMKIPSFEEMSEAKSSNEVAALWGQEFAYYFPPVDKLFAWEFGETLEAYRRGYRARFEQNPSHLRALLDTGDSLMVLCQRYMTATAEWTIGMREADLRLWMDIARVSTQHLTHMCNAPLSRRPAYLGGNRMGLLLVELRREFMSRGILPHNLPEMELTADEMLGSDSISEAMDLYEYYAPHDLADYHASIWISPLIVAAKRADDDDLWNRVQFRPPVPSSALPPTDEVEPTDEATTAETEEAADPHADLNDLDDFQLRNLVMTIVVRLRHMTEAKAVQDRKIAFLRTEIDRVRAMKQTMVELLEKAEKEVEEEEKRKQKEEEERIKAAELAETAAREAEEKARLEAEKAAQEAATSETSTSQPQPTIGSLIAFVPETTSATSSSVEVPTTTESQITYSAPPVVFVTTGWPGASTTPPVTKPQADPLPFLAAFDQPFASDYGSASPQTSTEPESEPVPITTSTSVASVSTTDITEAPPFTTTSTTTDSMLAVFTTPPTTTATVDTSQQHEFTSVIAAVTDPLASFVDTTQAAVSHTQTMSPAGKSQLATFDMQPTPSQSTASRNVMSMALATFDMQPTAVPAVVPMPTAAMLSQPPPPIVPTTTTSLESTVSDNAPFSFFSPPVSTTQPTIFGTATAQPSSITFGSPLPNPSRPGSH